MREYTFKLTDEQANTVLNALATRPYYEVAELIAEIQRQAVEQEREATHE